MGTGAKASDRIRYDFCFVNELNLKTGNVCGHLLLHSLTTYATMIKSQCKAFHFPIFGQNRPYESLRFLFHRPHASYLEIHI